HSAYLDTDAFKELQIGTQGEFGGLGIEVSMEDGFVKVISPIEDTPAFRAGIKIQSVKSKMIEPGYAYIRITQFQEQTGENLTKAIDKLFKESPVPIKGLVLDLRNDPGGLL